MTADVPTLLLMIIVTSLVTSGALLVLNGNQRNDGLQYWAGGLLLSALAHTLLLLYGRIPNLLTVVLGNVLLVRDLLQQAPGEAIRLALLSTHYRRPLDFRVTPYRVNTVVTDVGNRSIRLAAQIDDPESGTVYAQARAMNGGSDRFASAIPDEGLRGIAEAYHLPVNEAFLA